MEVRVCVSFVECLEILLKTLEKAPESVKNKHPNKFPKFLKIFGNLRKSSEISGSLWKSSGEIRKCRKALKTTFQHFLNFFLKSSEIIGSHWMSLEIFGNCRKVLKTTFQHF